MWVLVSLEGGSGLIDSVSNGGIGGQLVHIGLHGEHPGSAVLEGVIFLDLLFTPTFTSCLFLDTFTTIFWDLACVFLVAMISGLARAVFPAFCSHSKLLRLVPRL